MRWRKDRQCNHAPAGGDRLDDPKFQCCGCCHVQTGTICLGIYNMVTQLVCLSVLTIAVLNPHLIDQAARRYAGLDDVIIRGNDGNTLRLYDRSDKQSVDHVVGELTPLDKLEPLPTPLPLRATGEDDYVVGFGGNGMQKKDGFFYTKTDMYMFTQKRVQSGDLHLALALVFGLVGITLLLVYGAAKGRPVYLLPFFCFQMFDFILAILTAVGHYTYLPNLHDIIVSSPNVPFRNELLRVNSEWVALSVMIIYLFVLMVKGYFIGVVWSCYQYLQIRNGRVMVYAQDDVEQLLLPPDYDQATKMPAANYVPPPMYAQPPPGYSSE